MNKNSAVAAIAASVVFGMIGMSFAAVPLYKTFCRITGFGGTTQKAIENTSKKVLDRTITVRFDASIAKDLPWVFKPEQVSQTLRIGESGLAFFQATNNTDQPIIGTASFNVQPAKAGVYFMKVQCFCFTEQLLMPGETVHMPVTYFIDPELDENRRLDEVREITLSYTFYRNNVAEKRMRAEADAAAKVAGD